MVTVEAQVYVTLYSLLLEDMHLVRFRKAIPPSSLQSRANSATWREMARLARPRPTFNVPSRSTEQEQRQRLHTSSIIQRYVLQNCSTTSLPLKKKNTAKRQLSGQNRKNKNGSPQQQQPRRKKTTKWTLSSSVLTPSHNTITIRTH